MSTPAEERPLVEHDVHTEELPPLPQRDSRIVASHWIEAPSVIRALGDDLPGSPEAGYVRRIGSWLLWRSGPATGADARYAAVDADDLGVIHTYRLLADGTGHGDGPDGARHERFRAWKESLRDHRPG